MDILQDKLYSIGTPVAHYRADVMTEGDLTYNDSSATGTGLTGTNTITVSNPIVFFKGMYLALNTSGGEKHNILSIAGSVLTLENNLAADYTNTTIYFGCVSSLTDISGNENHCLQVSSASMPKLIKNHINGKKAFYTDGVDDYLLRAFDLKQPYSVHGFVEIGRGAPQFILDGYQTTWNYLRFSTNGVNNGDVEAFGGVKISFDGDALTNKKYFNAVFNKTRSYIRVNELSAQGDIGTVDPNGITLGRINAGTDFCSGHYLEIVVYNKATTITENNLIFSRLKTLYG